MIPNKDRSLTDREKLEKLRKALSVMAKAICHVCQLGWCKDCPLSDNRAVLAEIDGEEKGK